MTRLPSIRALKDLAALGIDNQMSQQAGAQIFNYTGKLTSDYHKVK